MAALAARHSEVEPAPALRGVRRRAIVAQGVRQSQQNCAHRAHRAANGSKIRWVNVSQHRGPNPGGGPRWSLPLRGFWAQLLQKSTNANGLLIRWSAVRIRPGEPKINHLQAVRFSNPLSLTGGVRDFFSNPLSASHSLGILGPCQPTGPQAKAASGLPTGLPSPQFPAPLPQFPIQPGQPGQSAFPECTFDGASSTWNSP
jgi:hypothetical protein